MNTQNTVVHVRLWRKSFWLMAIANLLLCSSVTILIPTMPTWLRLDCGLTDIETGITMGAFALGLLLPGPFCSYLVQHYRRNIVCMIAVLGLTATMLVPLYVPVRSILWTAFLRIVQGAFFGLSQMVLTSTLIIDTCEAFRRTEANHSATWFGRMALSLGPLAGLIIAEQLSFHQVLWVAAGCSGVVVLLIESVHFPFRVPNDDLHLLSRDRFLLSGSWPLLLNLFMAMVSIGIMLSQPLDAGFYASLMAGFLLALLAQRFVFADADLKSEVVSGLLLIITAQLIMLSGQSSVLCSPMAGLGLGLIGSRFLLFFIKLSRHCQRGTAQSTFMVAWECGLAIGVGIGYACFSENQQLLYTTSLTLSAAALLFYLAFTHRWFVKHKNR